MVKQSLVRIANKVRLTLPFLSVLYFKYILQATVDEISAVAGISSDTLTVNDARYVYMLTNTRRQLDQTLGSC